MIKIEMLDDDGRIEICESHECRGVDCESPANCEDCGAQASQAKPVYVWTSEESGMDYWACGDCIEANPFSRIKI